MDTMGEDIEGEDEVVGFDVMGEDVDGFDVVGARGRALMRAVRQRAPAARVARATMLPSSLRNSSPQGISRPQEEMDSLPFEVTQLGAGSAGRASQAVGLPQRPFRGERLIASALYQTAAGVVSDVSAAIFITPGIYVGAVQVGAAQGQTPLSVYAATSFGVRLTMPDAGQGTRIFIPWRADIAVIAGDTLVVGFTLIGRAVR